MLSFDPRNQARTYGFDAVFSQVSYLGFNQHWSLEDAPAIYESVVPGNLNILLAQCVYDWNRSLSKYSVHGQLCLNCHSGHQECFIYY